MFFQPYVPQWKRREKAERFAAALAKKEGRALSPVTIEGRAIATSFWGKAWCEHVEAHCDEENRLPRGRSYARNGSVIDLQIEEGAVTALVSGSSIYTVRVQLRPLAPQRFRALVDRCASGVGSAVELLEGRISAQVAAHLVDPVAGLFPERRDLVLSCSCPDYARMCKHVAATLYGVGARLDHAPELFFTLRSVPVEELVRRGAAGVTAAAAGPAELAEGSLGAIFGIELAGAPTAPARRQPAGERPPAVGAASGRRPSAPAAKHARAGPVAAKVSPAPAKVSPAPAAGWLFTVRREGKRGAPRRLRLGAGATLLDLAAQIHRAFGHDTDALWGFYLSGVPDDAATEYGPPGFDPPNEATVKLSALPLEVGADLLFVHDFEAELRHRVVLQERPRPAPRARRAGGAARQARSSNERSRRP